MDFDFYNLWHSGNVVSKESWRYWHLVTDLFYDIFL